MIEKTISSLCHYILYLHVHLRDVLYFWKFDPSYTKENTKMLLKNAYKCKRKLKEHSAFPTKQAVVNVSEKEACDRQQLVCQTMCVRNV